MSRGLLNKPRGSRAATALALVLSVLAASTGMAAAETVVSSKNLKPVTFDWNASRVATTPQKVARATLPRGTSVQLVGAGSYICSPAGFGKQSSCYAR